MKPVLLIPLLIYAHYCAFGQAPITLNELNAYHYSEINPPSKTADKAIITKGDLNATSFMESLLMDKGFLIVERDSTGRTPTFGGKVNMPEEVSINECTDLVWYWGFSQSDRYRQVLKVMAVNCHDEIIFENSVRVDPNTSLQSAIRTALAPVLKANYYYDEDLNHKLFIPKVMAVNDTEESLRQYFSTHDILPLEGIYKSIDNSSNEDLSFYKIAIKFDKGRYQIIVLDTDNNIWKPGDVKGYIDKTDGTTFQPATYYLSDKRKTEGFAELSDILLTFSMSVKSQVYKNGLFHDVTKTSEAKFIKISSK